MSIPITNLLASSNINIILSGQHQYTINNKAKMYTLLFKGPSTQIGDISDISEINLNGSGCSGSYLGKAVINQTNNRLKMTGSGGGNITGLPNIIYVNMTGIFDVNLTNKEAGYITGKLHFTGLLEITINGTRGNLNLVNPYGVIYLNTELKITFLSITLENTSTSVTFANCTRYISLGDFSIRFQI